MLNVEEHQALKNCSENSVSMLQGLQRKRKKVGRIHAG